MAMPSAAGARILFAAWQPAVVPEPPSQSIAFTKACVTDPRRSSLKLKW